MLPGKQTGAPVTVRLQPCGKAKVRFVNPAGEPIEGHWPNVEVMLSPGPSWIDPNAAMKGILAADTVALANILWDSYQMQEFRTDAEGRLTLRNLIPGVTYRIGGFDSNNPVMHDFVVRPSETLDLGDLVIGKKK